MATELKPFVTEAPSALMPEVLLNGTFHGRGAAETNRNCGEQLQRQTEQPWHRIAAKCLSMGMTNGEVAATCEVHPNTITALLKVQWFQELVTNFMEVSSADVTARIRAEQFNSIQLLCDLRDDPKVSPTVRSNICFNILDRHLGKPTQKVELAGVVKSNDPVAEAAQLEAEVLRLQQAAVTA